MDGCVRRSSFVFAFFSPFKRIVSSLPPSLPSFASGPKVSECVVPRLKVNTISLVVESNQHRTNYTTTPPPIQQQQQYKLLINQCVRGTHPPNTDRTTRGPQILTYGSSRVCYRYTHIYTGSNYTNPINSYAFATGWLRPQPATRGKGGSVTDDRFDHPSRRYA
eukprot:GHVU01048783.1.p1 GENE.GHVU01048783.1~~GHVU01048783.1.p1  ORF type:complete len:164 (+),score=10.02 GHVU01048783.1:25-516(+)